jgi:hypothetical protein
MSDWPLQAHRNPKLVTFQNVHTEYVSVQEHSKATVPQTVQGFKFRLCLS